MTACLLGGDAETARVRATPWTLVPLALVALAGTAAACEGLSPGDRIVTDGSSCTLGFLLAGPGALYFSTAGHCMAVNQTTSTPDHGDIGVGVFRHLEPETGSTSDGRPGDDFGLIRVHPDRHPDLNPKLCGWEGPVGLYEGGGEGGNVRHYGHGVGFGSGGPATQRREGYFLKTADEAFYWAGMGVMGDSGSAVLDEQGRALGVLTHLLVGVNGVPPRDNGGTRLQHGLRLAEAEGFTGLRLVLAGEDPVAVMRSLSPRAQDVAPGAPESEEPPATAPPPGGNATKPAPRNASAARDAPPAKNDSTLAPAATTAEGGSPRDAPLPSALLVAGALAGAAALARARRKG